MDFDFLSKEAIFKDSSFPFTLFKSPIKKGETIPRHTHDFVELVFVLEGSARHVMAGIEYILNPGDIFIVEPDVYHSYMGAEKSDTIVYNVLFERHFLEQEIQALSSIPSFIDFYYFSPFLRKNALFYPYLSVSGQYKLLMEMLLDSLSAELNNQQAGYQLVIKTRFIDFMIQLSRFYKMSESTVAVEQSDEQWLYTITSMLKQYYDQPFTLLQLSRLSGMSISNFTAKFKAYTNKTFLEYKHEIQLEEACRMLSATQLKVSDISERVGFKDLSFFYKVFRKQFGLTPLQYRQIQNKSQHT